MRQETFCLLGRVFVSSTERYEARCIEYEVAGANAWLHQDDRRRAYMLCRVGEAWQEAPLRIGITSWWARLISTEEWPPEGRMRIAINDEGTLSVDYDGDLHLSRVWTGRPASPWRASLTWNAKSWRIVRLR